ncbi:hypothetical protein G6F64_014373 [Rhizopus arrhizus]|uniref:Uncharacterized protein n=1 Tax=Rhizopus oryzae TaxID=64495 RepID=A0A9P7BJV8_RHIOR|nr:hypothetical protein G6F64_014373 [Rhizopus arrhizus]
MPGQADPVRHVVQVLGQLVQDLLRVRLQRGAAEVEHRPVLLVHDLDAQAFRRQVDQQLRPEALQDGAGGAVRGVPRRPWAALPRGCPGRGAHRPRCAGDLALPPAPRWFRPNCWARP